MSDPAALDRDALLALRADLWARLGEVDAALLAAHQQPAQASDQVLRIREACECMGWTYSWARRRWSKLGGYKDLDNGLKIRASRLQRN